MNSNNKVKAIAETSITAILMVIFAFVGLYGIPTLMIFYPIPYIVIGARHGIKYNIFALVVSSVAISLLTNTIDGVLLFIYFGILSISLSYMLRRKNSTSEVMIFNSGVAIISVLLAITFFDMITGVNLIDQIEVVLNDTVAMYLDGMNNVDFSNYQIEEMKSDLKVLIDYTLLLIPFFIITSSIIITYIVYWGSVVVLRRFNYHDIKIGRFKDFNLPHNIIAGSVVMILGSVVLRVLEMPYYETIFINVTAIIMFVFFIEGLAVIAYFMDRYKFNKILQGAMIILGVINSAIVSIVGLIDVLFDLRKLRRAK